MRVVHFVPETWYFHPRISKRENNTNFIKKFFKKMHDICVFVWSPLGVSLTLSHTHSDLP